VLLFATSGVDYWAAGRIAALPRDARARRVFLVLSLTANLGLLGFYKYADFVTQNLSAVLAALGLAATPLPRLDLVLPIGISFYTFESMSYTIDVYRGRIPPVPRRRSFLIFIAFFPHLVAGPIVRARDFLYQVERRRRPRLRVMAEGFYLMIRGFFIKVVLADNLAPVVDRLWPQAAAPGANASVTLLATALFALQILCDFEGYSTIARGAAYVMGFRLPVNFHTPYIAGTFKAFWERWHITLSQWLRDYLYLPLGGNRVARRRMYANLMIVMVLGGLWHGPAWTFLAWGALHGGALVVERMLGLHRLSKGSPILLQAAWFCVVQSVVLIAWIFFRSPTLAVATGMVRNLAAGSYGRIGGLPLGTLALLALPTLGGHLRTLLHERFAVPDLSHTERALWGAAMLYAVCTAAGPTSAFIYFQF
jgi:alginate O-acetyltransferase complex protein AlgI